MVLTDSPFYNVMALSIANIFTKISLQMYLQGQHNIHHIQPIFPVILKIALILDDNGADYTHSNAMIVGIFF